METELKVWKSRIQQSMGMQSQMHQSWQDAIDLYNCVYFDKVKGGRQSDRVDVHFANWYINNLIPLVYFRDPFIFIKPKHDKYESFADTMEKVINYYWRELSLKQEFKRVIFSGFLMPPGWIKIGYTAKIGQDIAKIEEEKNKGLIQEIKDTIKGVFKKEKEEKTPEQLGILNEYIKEENIFATWIPSWNILLPQGYHLVNKMPWICEIEDVPIIDFKSNPLYKHQDIKPTRELKNENYSGESLSKPTYNNTLNAVDEGTNIVRLFHIEDRRSQKRLTISMESNEPHFEGDLVSPEGFSYEPLIFEETLPSLDKSNPYPPNILQPILPQIIEQSMARTQMARYRKRSGAIILVQKGLATEEDIGQLEESDAVQLVQVSNLQSFLMTQTPALPADVFNIDEIIKQDLQMGTSMGQMMFAAQSGQRTATQASIGQSGLQLKSSARVDIVEDFTVRVARKMGMFAWKYLDREKISEIIGEDATENMWPTLPEDKSEVRRILQSEVEFRIDAGSTAPPKDETVDRKQLLDALSIVMNFAPERLKKDEVLKQLFKKFKFDKMQKIVISQDDEEIKSAMDENNLMLQGSPQVVTPNENHMLHIQTHNQAKGNQLVDQHIIEHGKFMGIKPNQPGESDKAQQGDMRPPLESTNPEIMRQGIPTQGDVYQSAQNRGAGTGNKAR